MAASTNTAVYFGYLIDKGDINKVNETFQASAGVSFGPTGSCIVYDETHAQMPVCHQTDFGTTYTPSDEGLVEVKNPRVQVIAQQGVTS